MKLARRIKVPHYGPALTLTLIVSDDIASICRKRDPEHDWDCAAAATFLEWPHCFILIRDDHIDFNSIGHEVDHAVHKILRKIGIVECDESEEAFTYLHGWMTKWTVDTLISWKLIKVSFVMRSAHKKRRYSASPSADSKKVPLGMPPKIRQASS